MERKEAADLVLRSCTGFLLPQALFFQTSLFFLEANRLHSFNCSVLSYYLNHGALQRTYRNCGAASTENIPNDLKILWNETLHKQFKWKNTSKKSKMTQNNSDNSSEISSFLTSLESGTLNFWPMEYGNHFQITVHCNIIRPSFERISPFHC